ncbi:hypothetical protein TNCV_795221 [Trichonephila clavipes]|nr:hypothetical protein TNCV_795221 [Trichonephila clavipes]
MPPNTLRVHADLYAEIVEVEIEVVSQSIVPSGNFAELNRTVTCMVLKANDRRTSCPCRDEFRGRRSDYVRQLSPSDFNLSFEWNSYPKKESNKSINVISSRMSYNPNQLRPNIVWIRNCSDNRMRSMQYMKMDTV